MKEASRLMGDVQTALLWIGVELKRLGIPVSTVPDSDSRQPPVCPAFDSLSPREFEIVQLLIAGNRASTIAESLSISYHTVRNHLRSVYRKVGIHSQVELFGKFKGSAGPSRLPRNSPRHR